MNKKFIIGIFIGVIVVIIGVFAWIKLNNTLVDPNRTITIEKENNEWKVTNEGY